MFKTLNKHNFGNQNCKLKLNIKDDFYKENEGSHILHLENGFIKENKNDEFDVEVNMHISEFSSLMVGAVSFKTLFKYGLTEISNENYIDTVHKIFLTDTKPVCTLGF